jgi:hypothetical protein
MEMMMRIGSFVLHAAVPGAAIALMGAAASAATTLYSDLGSGNTYNCCGAWTVGGMSNTAPAISFTASAGGSVTQIDIALQNHGSVPGADGATVSLWTDVSGQLGAQLGSWSVSNFPAFGSSNSALTAITGITGVSLAAGANYYLQAAPAAGGATSVAWNWNTVGATSTILENGVSTSGNLTGAFDVLGTSVPEPATWAMLIMGLGMIGFAARRRKAGLVAAA